MTYVGKSQQYFFMVLLVIVCLSTRANYITILPLALLVFFIAVRYELEVDKKIAFRARLLGMVIYHREYAPNEIKHFRYRRIGAQTKGVSIKPVKGLGILISNYKPERVLDDLFKYARKHQIPIRKTKTFIALEETEAAKKHK